MTDPPIMTDPCETHQLAESKAGFLEAEDSFLLLGCKVHVSLQLSINDLVPLTDLCEDPCVRKWTIHSATSDPLLAQHWSFPLYHSNDCEMTMTNMETLYGDNVASQKHTDGCSNRQSRHPSITCLPAHAGGMVGGGVGVGGSVGTGVGFTTKRGKENTTSCYHDIGNKFRAVNTSYDEVIVLDPSCAMMQLQSVWIVLHISDTAAHVLTGRVGVMQLVSTIAFPLVNLRWRNLVWFP